MFAGIMTTIWNIIAPIVEIGTLTYVFYRFHVSVAQTKAQQIAKIVFILVAGYSLARLLHMETFLWLYRYMTIPMVIFMCVVYQPDCRQPCVEILPGFADKGTTSAVLLGSGTFTNHHETGICHTFPGYSMCTCTP